MADQHHAIATLMPCWRGNSGRGSELAHLGIGVLVVCGLRALCAWLLRASHVVWSTFQIAPAGRDRCRCASAALAYLFERWKHPFFKLKGDIQPVGYQSTFRIPTQQPVFFGPDSCKERTHVVRAKDISVSIVNGLTRSKRFSCFTSYFLDAIDRAFIRSITSTTRPPPQLGIARSSSDEAS